MRKWRFFSGGGLVIVALIMVSLSAQPMPLQANEPTATPALAMMSEQLVAVWQTELTEDAAIIAPSDLVVDGEGNIYVSSQSLKAVKKFNSDGKLVNQWGDYGNGEGKFIIPSGINVDAQGNVYVADFGNIRVQKFDSDGKFLLQFPTAPPRGPASLGVDMWGNIYVNNFALHDYYVQKFDSKGKLLLTWGTTGSGDGEFSASPAHGPEDLMVDKDGHVYVADKLNHRIQKFDSDGKFVTIFGGEVSKNGNGQFYDPLGLSLDSKGNLYVIDSYFLQKLDPKGNPIAQWATFNGDLRQPKLVTVDSQGYIYMFAKPDHPSNEVGLRGAYIIKKYQQPWSAEMK